MSILCSKPSRGFHITWGKTQSPYFVCEALQDLRTLPLPLKCPSCHPTHHLLPPSHTVILTTINFCVPYSFRFDRFHSQGRKISLMRNHKVMKNKLDYLFFIETPIQSFNIKKKKSLPTSIPEALGEAKANQFG